MAVDVVGMRESDHALAHIVAVHLRAVSLAGYNLALLFWSAGSLPAARQLAATFLFASCRQQQVAAYVPED